MNTKKAYIKNTGKPLETLPLTAFVTVQELIEMVEQATGHRMKATSLHTSIKNPSEKGYFPKLDAIRIGTGRHSLWLITKESAAAYIEKKGGIRVRPRPKKEDE